MAGVGAIELPVTADDVRALVSQQFPDLRPVTARYFAAGWDFQMFEVNARALFRFPKRRACVEGLELERRLLAWLDGRLPIAVPDYRWWGQPSPRFGHAFGGYEILPGHIACRVDPASVNLERILDQVTEFLTAMRAVSVPDVKALGLAELADADSAPSRLERARALAPQIEAALDAPTFGRLSEYLARVEPVELDACPIGLVHSDLTSVHVLVAPDGSELSGVIDWGDVCIGPRIGDYVGWYAWLGEPFAQRLLARAGDELGRSALAWIRQRCICVGVNEVFHFAETGNDNDRLQGLCAIASALPF